MHDKARRLQSELWLAEVSAGVVVVHGRAEPGHEDAAPQRAPWTVDLHELERALDRLLERVVTPAGPSRPTALPS